MGKFLVLYLSRRKIQCLYNGGYKTRKVLEIEEEQKCLEQQVDIISTNTDNIMLNQKVKRHFLFISSVMQAIDFPVALKDM